MMSRFLHGKVITDSANAARAEIITSEAQPNFINNLLDNSKAKYHTQLSAQLEETSLLPIAAQKHISCTTMVVTALILPKQSSIITSTSGVHKAGDVSYWTTCLRNRGH
jgi:hypothetical protein